MSDDIAEIFESIDPAISTTVIVKFIGKFIVEIGIATISEYLFPVLEGMEYFPSPTKR